MRKKKAPGVVTITLEREDLERIFNGTLDRISELKRKPLNAKTNKIELKGGRKDEHKMSNTGN